MISTFCFAALRQPCHTRDTNGGANVATVGSGPWLNVRNGGERTFQISRFSAILATYGCWFDPDWKLYARALDILEGRTTGHALPIIRKLVRRRFPPAITVFTDYVPEAEAIRLLRQQARRGDATAAYNLAVTHRNRGDMLGYRTSLARAAKLDADAASELRRFMTRFPEEVMRRFGRLAPEQS